MIKEIIDEEEKRTLRMQKEAISRYNSQGSIIFRAKDILDELPNSLNDSTPIKLVQ